MIKNNLMLCIHWNRYSKLLTHFLILFCIQTITIGQSKDEKKILEVFRLEEEYWSKGDIDAYVSLYAPEDSVRMLYSTGAVYGRDNILAFYKKYWPKERMGKLTLDETSLEKLSNKFYFVSGKFHVTYNDDRKPVHGRFSGLMKKIKGRWYIYTDHSG
jgi:ketosteroid isomerase-like protein